MCPCLGLYRIFFVKLIVYLFKLLKTLTGSGIWWRNESSVMIKLRSAMEVFIKESYPMGAHSLGRGSASEWTLSTLTLGS